MNNNQITQASMICPYCETTTQNNKEKYSTQVSLNEKYDLIDCPSCMGTFLYPTPSAARLKEAYSNVYYGSGEKKFPGIIGKIFDSLQEFRVRKFLKYLPTDAKIIDIGCGSGVFIQQMIKLGYSCTGVELPGAAADRASLVDSLELVIGKLEDLSLPKSEYDFVMLWHVFEHLEKPKLALDILSNVTKPNGYVTIALPNIKSLQSRIFAGSWFHLDPPRHLYFLDRIGLKREMSKLGFSLVETSYWSLEYNPFGIQQSFLNLFMKKRDRLYELLKKNKKYTESYILKTLLLIYFVITTPFAIILAIIETLLKRGGSLCLVFRKD